MTRPRSPDHFIVRNEGAPIRGVWEGWTTLAGIAAGTSKITLGVFVTCLGWRNPGIVAKMAENLDEISGGRFVLGLGAGWHQPEYDMFGMPFDHRVARFEDAIKIINPFLREGRPTIKASILRPTTRFICREGHVATRAARRSWLARMDRA